MRCCDDDCPWYRFKGKCINLNPCPQRISIPEHSADSPGGVSGPSRCSRRVAARTAAGLPGKPTFTPRSGVNARPVRTDGPPRDSGTHEAVVGADQSIGGK